MNCTQFENAFTTAGGWFIAKYFEQIADELPRKLKGNKL